MYHRIKIQIIFNIYWNNIEIFYHLSPPFFGWVMNSNDKFEFDAATFLPHKIKEFYNYVEYIIYHCSDQTSVVSYILFYYSFLSLCAEIRLFFQMLSKQHL